MPRTAPPITIRGGGEYRDVHVRGDPERADRPGRRPSRLPRRSRTRWNKIDRAPRHREPGRGTRDAERCVPDRHGRRRRAARRSRRSRRSSPRSGTSASLMEAQTTKLAGPAGAQEAPAGPRRPERARGSASTLTAPGQLLMVVHRRCSLRRSPSTSGSRAGPRPAASNVWHAYEYWHWFDGYWEALTSEVFWEAMWRTVLFTVVCVAVEFAPRLRARACSFSRTSAAAAC